MSSHFDPEKKQQTSGARWKDHYLIALHPKCDSFRSHGCAPEAFCSMEAPRHPRDVADLSDDDIEEPPAAKKKPKKDLRPEELQTQIKRLQLVVSAKCRCSAGNCRATFKNNAALCHQLLQQRTLLMELPKQESDRTVSC